MLTLTGAGVGGPQLDTAPTDLIFSNVTTDSLTLAWTPGTGPTPDYFQVEQRLTNPPTRGMFGTEFGNQFGTLFG